MKNSKTKFIEIHLSESDLKDLEHYGSESQEGRTILNEAQNKAQRDTLQLVWLACQEQRRLIDCYKEEINDALMDCSMKALPDLAHHLKALDFCSRAITRNFQTMDAVLNTLEGQNKC